MERTETIALKRDHCSGSGAEIVWALTLTGRRMPLDVGTTHAGAKGAQMLVGMNGRDTPVVRSASPLLDGDKPAYISHFATCPQSGQFRRKTR